MILKTFIKDIIKSKNFGGTLSEKFSAFLTLFRLQIKCKIYKKLNKVYSHRIFGFKFFGYDYNTIKFLFNEVFMTGEYYFEPADKKPLIIDCGSNIGMSVVYFKKLFPESRIITFEANPKAFALLEKNISENKIQNVELNNIALYDKDTEISFFIGDNVGTLLGSVSAERGGSNELKVKACKLSDVLNKYDAIDLIKMDIEGAEENVIADLFESGTISKPKEYIIEYHHNMNNEKSKLAAFLQKFESSGYSYSIRTEYTKLNSFQDILIHFYKK
jgi:FkbM family methyltransferase